MTTQYAMFQANTCTLQTPCLEHQWQKVVVTHYKRKYSVCKRCCVPATEQHLNTYWCAQGQDLVCQQVIKYCRKGWPRKRLVKPDIAPYWKVRGSLTVCNWLLLYDHQIVVPKSLQGKTKQKIHVVHQGIWRCRAKLPDLHGAREWVSRLLKLCNSVLSVPRIPLLTRNHQWFHNCQNIHG